MQDGPDKFSGIIFNESKKVFDRSGLAVKYSAVPFLRHLKAIQDNERPACSVGFVLVPSRNDFALQSDPVMFDGQIGVLMRASNPAVAKYQSSTFEALFSDPDLVLAKKIDASLGPVLDEKVARLKTRLMLSALEAISRVKQIHISRGDYIVMQKIEADYLIESAGLPKEDFRHFVPTDAPPGNARVLLCTKLFGADRMAAFNRAIAR